MPHNAMALLFGAAFLYAIVALAMGVRAFWRDIGEPAATLGEPRSLWQAMKDAGELRYLDGGGLGCFNEDERPTDRRRLYHHLTFYGFLLCFAATSVATLYHYLLGREAPYPWCDLPVVLGTLGGIGLLSGRRACLPRSGKRDPMLLDEQRYGMDVAFIADAVPDQPDRPALLVLRETSAMGCCSPCISAWCSLLHHHALRQVRARHLPLRRAGPLREGAGPDERGRR